MRRLGIWLILIFLAWPLSSAEMENENPIKRADAFYQAMADMATAEKALALYREALVQSEDKYEAYWKIARIMYYIGEHTEGKKEKRNIFSQAVYHADKAVNLKPDQPDGYYWRGVNNGKFGEAKGVLKSLSLVKPIKKDMNTVIEMNRDYEDGGPDRVLGRVYFKLPGLAGGSTEKSYEHLIKSKELGPDDCLTRLYLAETLLDMDEPDRAQGELEFVLGMEDDPSWVNGVMECKAMAKELLEHKKFR
jgi:tetratricopeptide (TPR) repeat protein